MTAHQLRHNCLVALLFSLLPCLGCPKSTEKSYYVLGRVVDQQGAAVQGAKVETKGYQYFEDSRDNFSEYYYSTTTDSNGKFEAEVSTICDDNKCPSSLTMVGTLYFRVTSAKTTKELAVAGDSLTLTSSGKYEARDLVF